MNNSLFNDFAARFAVETLESLIESFNRQVGNRGCSLCACSLRYGSHQRTHLSRY